MLARYLGSKQTILEPLLNAVGDFCEPGEHVVDIFSGSIAVSMGLKQAGYRVTANDINLFSSTLAQAYLIPTSPPRADVSILPEQSRGIALDNARTLISALKGRVGFLFLEEPDWRRDFESFVALQHYLQTVEYSQLDPEYRRTDFYDAYCEDGVKSSFVSMRGTTGKRRFFSPTNARRLDLAVNQLRQWKHQDLLDTHTHSLLLATLLRAVEKVSNTQGTYHDFPRAKWDSRALRSLSLDPPPLDAVVAGIGGHSAGKEQDSLEYIGSVDDHALLYLDPPYNFRQYTAYYFLPNVICRYTDIDDLDQYFDKLTYVRGQNPEDDFVSTFCKPASFIDDMRTLISRAKCDRVMISYFNGKNHWSKFDSGPSDVGQGLLQDMLGEEMFEPSSLSVRSVTRRNYASYGGYKAREVEELILTAELKKNRENESTERSQQRLQPVA